MNQTVNLLDRLGYLIHQPNVPVPLSQIIIWDEDTYLAVNAAEDGTPQFHWVHSHVITDTRPSGVYKRSELGLT